MSDSRKTILNIRDLRRYYQMGDTQVRAVNGVDFEVREGDFIMIVGSSGSGKSTLMHILGLLDQPTGGYFDIREEDVARCDDERLSLLRNRHIGFVFQQFNLLSDLSVIENIALPLAYRGIEREERLERASVYAKRLGLGDRLDHLPTELSGGQMQRVAIARALVSEPDIIMADEPTGNLDSKTSREIMDLLYELHAEGYTLIMVTHDPRLAEQGTRKVTIQDGKILSDETRERKPPEKPKPAHQSDVRENAGLNFSELIRIGFREGILTQKMRSFLTMLGIVIGVSSVIAMSSFSLGSKQKQADQIRALGANLVRIIDKHFENERLTEARGEGSFGLSREDLRQLKASLDVIDYAALVREVKMTARHVRGSLNPRILGIGGDYFRVNNLALAKGRSFDAYDRETQARVCILGYGLAQELGGEDLIGSHVLLGGKPYTVIGILEGKYVDLKELEATGAADINKDLLLPIETLWARTTFLPLRSEVDEIQLQLSTEDSLYEVGSSISRILGTTHKGVEDYEVVIPMELLKQKQQSQKLLDILTICISSVSVVVGGIGIMNIMLASVTERIREIGIRRAVGATRRDILLQFLSESVIISVCGGAIGILLAMLVVLLVSSLIAIPIVFSTFTLLASVLASTFTGLAFGIYPAWQAANKNPVEALRYE